MPQSRSTAPVTALLAVALVGAYALELAAGGEVVCDRLGLVPAHPSVKTAFFSLFLHDPGSLLHIGGNLAFLLAFGPTVERALGSLRFTALYVAAGLAGAATHVLVDPASTGALVGASGAIFGIVAVAAVLRPRMLGFAVALGGVEVWHAFFGGGGSVSFGCHLGGLIVGFVAVALMRLTGDEALELAR